METNDPRRGAQERAAESPTMAALRRIMIASSMGLATVALVAANTSAALGGSGQTLSSGPSTSVTTTLDS